MVAVLSLILLLSGSTVTEGPDEVVKEYGVSPSKYEMPVCDAGSIDFKQ